MNSDLINIYIRRFVNRQDIWFKQWDNAAGYTFIRPGCIGYEPLTDVLIKRHLKGLITVDLPAMDDQGQSKWICWRISTAVYLDLMKLVLKSLRLFPLEVHTGSERHLWLTLDRPLPAHLLELCSSRILELAEVSISDIKTKKIESFPESKMRLSHVLGPLGINNTLNVRALFEGPGQLLEDQLAWLAKQPLNDSCRLERLAISIQADQERIKRQIDTLSCGRRQFS